MASVSYIVRRALVVFVIFSFGLPLLLLLHAPSPSLEPFTLRTGINTPNLKGWGGFHPDQPLAAPPSAPSGSHKVVEAAPARQAMEQTQAPVPVIHSTPRHWNTNDPMRGVPGAGGEAGMSQHSNLSATEMLQQMSDPPDMNDVISYLDAFIRRLHQLFLSLHDGTKMEVYEAYRSSAEETLLPFDRKFKGKNIYPVRNDESIFMSIASYRDHRLTNTLVEAYSKAKHPEKLFMGVVMQNCFEKCKTGVMVVSPPGVKPARTEIRDAPPDAHGVKDFCEMTDFQKYCDSGNIRLLTVREAESLGPAVARYFASKLWGGEQYFVQIDSHIWFDQDWDAKLVDMMQRAPSKKPVISTYPPGQKGHWQGTRSPRLCTAIFSGSPVEEHIIRINVLTSARVSDQFKDLPVRPASYIAAGFFAAPAQFLAEAPYDPFVPWVFMGEEIALSVRFWTNGWDIFAPDRNILAHEYRPGSLGLPKFWETVGRVFGRPGFNTQLMKMVVCRVKHMIGYSDCQVGGQALINPKVLFALDEYGLGDKRSLEDYFKMTEIDIKKLTAGIPEWCKAGSKPDLPGYEYATEL